jgi:hypothetical protein
LKNFFHIFIQRGLLIGLGLVTLFFITLFLDDYQQGVYYTFGSLISAYNLIELGLPFLLLQISSGFLKKNDHISQSFLNKLIIYITFKSILATSVFLIFGNIYLSKFYIEYDFYTFLFWSICSVFIGMAIFSNAFLAIFESLGKITDVYNSKSIAIIIGSIVLWLFLGSNFYLIGPGIIIFFTFLLTIILWKKKFKFIRFIKGEKIEYFSWGKNIFFMQKQVGYDLIGNYIFYFSPTLVLFPFIPKIAGFYGLSVILISSIIALASSLIQSKIYYFTDLINSSHENKGIRVFLKSFIFSNILFIFMSLIFFFVYFFLPEKLQSRLLDFPELLRLFLNFFLMNFIFMSFYLFRAKKNNPFSKYYLLINFLMLFTQIVLLKTFQMDPLLTILNTQLFFYLPIFFGFLIYIYILFRNNYAKN